jgi:hypothetical protein
MTTPAPEARPMDFATYLLSLGTSALVQLGDAPDPEGEGPAAPDLEGARQTIDVLALLEAKTRGNLDSHEARLLANLLYDLRLRFVQRARA